MIGVGSGVPSYPAAGDPQVWPYMSPITGCIEAGPRRVLASGQMSNTDMSTGVGVFSIFVAERSATVNGFWLDVNTPSTGATTTLARMALYTVDATGEIITPVARSSSIPTLFEGVAAVKAHITMAGVTTVAGLAFNTTGGYAASYSLVRGARYAVGALAVGATSVPRLTAAPGSGRLNNLALRISGRKTGLTDLDAAVTFTAGSDQLGVQPWFGLNAA